MITVKIFGGLGNQMFQYAAGYSMARAANCELALDLRWFLRNRQHQGYELQKVFGIATRAASDADVRDVCGVWRLPFIRRVLGALSFQYGSTTQLLRERTFHYDEAVRRLSGRCYLQGYWQSFKYFIDYNDDVTRMFSFPPIIDDKNLMLLSHIESSNSVSVHVRRGDYVSSKKATTFHGVLGKQYYEKAFNVVRARLEKPHFMVFSDDANIRGHVIEQAPDVTFVFSNTAEYSYRDMQLMSRCRHNIIANSTFSWWAAWLNPNNSKLVVCPKRWFMQDVFRTDDLLPPAWCKV